MGQLAEKQSWSTATLHGGQEFREKGKDYKMMDPMAKELVTFSDEIEVLLCRVRFDIPDKRVTPTCVVAGRNRDLQHVLVWDVKLGSAHGKVDRIGNVRKFSHTQEKDWKKSQGLLPNRSLLDPRKACQICGQREGKKMCTNFACRWCCEERGKKWCPEHQVRRPR